MLEAQAKHPEIGNLSHALGCSLPTLEKVCEIFACVDAGQESHLPLWARKLFKAYIGQQHALHTGGLVSARVVSAATPHPGTIHGPYLVPHSLHAIHSLLSIQGYWHSRLGPNGNEVSS